MASRPKVVILTGASRGIGLAIAHILLKKQHNLVVVARTASALKELHSQYPEQVRVLPGDLADFSLAQKAVDLALSTWSRIDGLIVNHGVLAAKRLIDLSAEEMRAGFDTNVFSAVALIKAALPELRTTKGTIIFTSSGAASSAYSSWGTYGASKAVLNHLAMTLSVEEPEITSMSIRPGVVNTDMQREIREVFHSVLDKKDVDKFCGLKSSGGLLRPEQPGYVIAQLVLGAPKELSGRYFSWNDRELAAFQES